MKKLDFKCTLTMAAYNGDVGSGSMAASQRAEIGVAERRQLTVMFCDLVGSTALAQRHDLEDFREVVTSFLACCADVAKRFDGYVARYMGDGLLVYFGYPEASEHDAERAILAGLAIVSAVTSQLGCKGWLSRILSRSRIPHIDSRAVFSSGSQKLFRRLEG